MQVKRTSRPTRAYIHFSSPLVKKRASKKNFNHICIIEHIGHASSHLSPPTSLRRMGLVSRSMASAWDGLVSLSPLVRGHVGVCSVYKLIATA